MTLLTGRTERQRYSLSQLVLWWQPRFIHNFLFLPFGCYWTANALTTPKYCMNRESSICEYFKKLIVNIRLVTLIAFEPKGQSQLWLTTRNSWFTIVDHKDIFSCLRCFRVRVCASVVPFVIHDSRLVKYDYSHFFAFLGFCVLTTSSYSRPKSFIRFTSLFLYLFAQLSKACLFQLTHRAPAARLSSACFTSNADRPCRS